MIVGSKLAPTKLVLVVNIKTAKVPLACADEVRSPAA